MKTVVCKLGPCEGRGATKTAAREAAEQQVALLDQGTWTPVVVACPFAPANVAVAWRTPWGWSYKRGNSRCECQCGTQAEALRSAAVGLAQDAWHHGMTDSDCWALVEWVAGYGDTGLLSWIGFQRAYRAAPADLVEHERHQWACWHGREHQPAAA